ncbi:MAG: HD domain-containing protein [Bacillota bacterium]
MQVDLTDLKEKEEELKYISYHDQLTGIYNRFYMEEEMNRLATKTEVKQDLYDIINKADDNMYQNKLTEKRSAKSKLVDNLLSTLGAKSHETERHAKRMSDLAEELGTKINLSDNQLNKLSLLATLHDIGKVTISEDILKKPGKLNREEWGLLKNTRKEVLG